MDNRKKYSQHMDQAARNLQEAQSFMDKMELDLAHFGPAKKAALKEAVENFNSAAHFARLVRASLKRDSYEARSKWENLVEKAEFSAFQFESPEV